MARPWRLAAILAHPDDESMGIGSTLAHYSALGTECHLIMATRGEKGWMGPAGDYPGPAALGRLREAELTAAAAVLGLTSVHFLDYIDGELDRVTPADGAARIADYLQVLRPDVVVTFGADGAYGHPDHVAVSQLAAAACVMAAAGTRAHQVQAMYWLALTAEHAAAFVRHFGSIAMDVDGVTRTEVVWPDWAITTRLDVGTHYRRAWQAVRCHASQLPNLDELDRLPDEEHAALWGHQNFYRVWSTGGVGGATDLFDGLNAPHSQ